MPADETSVAVLSGRWTYNAAKSRPIDPDLRITPNTNRTLHAEGGPSAPYDFDLVGGAYPLSNGRTIAWVPTARQTWRVTKRRNTEVLETVTVTLTGNTLRTAASGALLNGSPYERTVTYRREGYGEELIGRWQSIRVDTGTTWDGFVISLSDDGVVTWRIPTDLQVIKGRLDGSDLAIVGPNGQTGSTIAVRVAGARRFAYVLKDAGRIAERGTFVISRDGRWLTELTWHVDQPNRKSKLVYERAP